MDGARALVDLRAFRRQHLRIRVSKGKPDPVPQRTGECIQVALEVNDVPPRAARQRAMELLEYLGVGGRASNLPGRALRWRAAARRGGRALANQPSLILADEPTAALDSQRGRQVMELFAQVAHERRAGVIVVTHNARALDVFDRILDVEDGMIRSRTPIADAISTPTSSATTTDTPKRLDIVER